MNNHNDELTGSGVEQKKQRRSKASELEQRVAYLEYAVQRLENTIRDMSVQCGGIMPKVLRENDL